jgi:signal transduction histidine kinase
MEHLNLLDGNVGQPYSQQSVRERRGDVCAALRSSRATHRLVALGEMTGSVVHDIRNLLTVIESGLSLTERNADRPEAVQANILRVRRAIGRGLMLASQLMEFAKQQDRQPGEADANELLRDLAPLLEYAAKPAARIALDFGPNLPRCLVDRSQFDAALLNLVINARDAMPNGGGEIRISTDHQKENPNADERGSWVRVRVNDNGMGMSADVLGKIFDPFFTTKGEKGTGLGLPQVSALVRQISGRVQIMSEPRVGTTVTLMFPLA